jgi:hypothetical protein
MKAITCIGLRRHSSTSSRSEPGGDTRSASVGCTEQSDEHLSLRLNDYAAAPPANRSDASSLFLGPGGVEGAVSGGVSEKPVVGKFNHSGRGYRNPAMLTRCTCCPFRWTETPPSLRLVSLGRNSTALTTAVPTSIPAAIVMLQSPSRRRLYRCGERTRRRRARRCRSIPG